MDNLIKNIDVLNDLKNLKPSAFYEKHCKGRTDISKKDVYKKRYNITAPKSTISHKSIDSHDSGVTVNSELSGEKVEKGENDKIKTSSSNPIKINKMQCDIKKDTTKERQLIINTIKTFNDLFPELLIKFDVPENVLNTMTIEELKELKNNYNFHLNRMNRPDVEFIKLLLCGISSQIEFFVMKILKIDIIGYRDIIETNPEFDRQVKLLYCKYLGEYENLSDEIKILITMLNIAYITWSINKNKGKNSKIQELIPL